jgi:hypothetical protein
MSAQDNDNVLQLDSLIPAAERGPRSFSRTSTSNSAKMFLCPAYKPFLWQNWLNVYGIRKNGPTNCVTGPNGIFLKVDCVSNPTEYLLVGDTTARPGRFHRAPVLFLRHDFTIKNDSRAALWPGEWPLP